MKYKLIAVAVLAVVLLGLYLVTEGGNSSAPASTDSGGAVLHP